MIHSSIATLFVILVLVCACPEESLAERVTPARNAQPKTAAEKAEDPGPAKGTLVIMGGGSHEEEILKRFVELAGGASAKIVYIPTAVEDAGLQLENAAKEWEKQGVPHVMVLHTRDPKEADTEKFVEPIKSATGVWFGGGRQWRLADAYLNTRTHTELKALLERGGVIGGTSAGATIQGSFLVRGDTKGNEVMEGDHLLGLGFLNNVAIDQHILRRNRQFDLIPVIEAHPELLGIGIDEDTAIVVQNNQFEVIGASYVMIVDPRQWTSGDAKSPNKAAQKGKFYFLSKGERFDLRARKIIEKTDPSK